jgi:hypothetical protein
MPVLKTPKDFAAKLNEEYGTTGMTAIADVRKRDF